MFHGNYIEARTGFREAARDKGFMLSSYPLDGLKGIDGEALTIDVAVKGQGNQLVLTSGLHGVEGYAGSGCQINCLRQLGELRCKLILIHSINPYGFSFNSRTNENCVDLNRNCGPTYPANYNPDYDSVHETLYSWATDTQRPTFEKARDMLVRLEQKMGARDFAFAVTSGQFRHPRGLFYGGQEQQLSLILLQAILKEHCSPTASKTLIIDYHTGLGPSGYGELIFMGKPGHPGRRLSEEWLGDVRCPAVGDSASNEVRGSAENLFIRPAYGKSVSHVALEFGTVPLLDVLAGLCCDLWIRGNPDAAPKLGTEMRAAVRSVFLGTTPQWRSAVLQRSQEVIGKALDSLRQ